MWWVASAECTLAGRADRRIQPWQTHAVKTASPTFEDDGMGSMKVLGPDKGAFSPVSAQLVLPPRLRWRMSSVMRRDSWNDERVNANQCVSISTHREMKGFSP